MCHPRLILSGTRVVATVSCLDGVNRKDAYFLTRLGDNHAVVRRQVVAQGFVSFEELPENFQRQIPLDDGARGGDRVVEVNLFVTEAERNNLRQDWKYFEFTSSLTARVNWRNLITKVRDEVQIAKFSRIGVVN